MMLNPLEHPVCLEYPQLTDTSAWTGHIPFAMFVVSAIKPSVIVELGAYRGVSYCAFCQAVKTLSIDTKCYAVDTWQGDPHAGELENSVWEKLSSYHDPLYSGFSRLVRAEFDEALANFDDGSIDLLHIDGFHTYEAVRHDFESWLPKMSSRGIVLFHDVNVREKDFGVWKFWAEVSSDRPSFEFVQSHGLGVLAVGKEIPGALRPLFEASDSETAIIRDFFAALGMRIEASERAKDQQIYLHALRTYEEVVHGSKLMRIYRILKDEGVGSLIGKGASGISKRK